MLIETDTYRALKAEAAALNEKILTMIDEWKALGEPEWLDKQIDEEEARMSELTRKMDEAFATGTAMKNSSMNISPSTSSKSLEDMERYALSTGNLQASVEIGDYEKFFGKTVRIVKGKKDVGAEGKVFWLKRQHYGKSEWSGWTTRIGIKDASGAVYWSNTDNVTVV